MKIKDVFGIMLSMDFCGDYYIIWNEGDSYRLTVRPDGAEWSGKIGQYGTFESAFEALNECILISYKHLNGKEVKK